MIQFPNFTLEEFLTSDTARKKRIENYPTWDAVDNLTELVSTIIQPLRTAWGSGIKITSGFRCPELNKAVKGSETSVHMRGMAADMVPLNGQFAKFTLFIQDFLTRNNIPFDQLLIESNSRGDRWIHIGIRNNAGEQRRQIKTMNVK